MVLPSRLAAHNSERWFPLLTRFFESLWIWKISDRTKCGVAIFDVAQDHRPKLCIGSDPVVLIGNRKALLDQGLTQKTASQLEELLCHGNMRMCDAGRSTAKYFSAIELSRHEIALHFFNRRLIDPNEELPNPGMSVYFVVKSFVDSLQRGPSAHAIEKRIWHRTRSRSS